MNLRRKLGLRRSVGRLWHHFFRDSTLPPHQAFKDPTQDRSQFATESFKMTNPAEPASNAVPSTSTPTQAQSQSNSTTDPSSAQQNLPIRDAKSAKAPAQQQGQQPAKGKDGSAPAAAGAEASGDKALTPAELKKKAKAEKAARRAKEKLEREQGGAGPVSASAPSAGGQGRPPTTPKKDAVGAGAAQKGSRGVPPPRRASGPVAQTVAATEQKKQKDDKKVAVFGHLYGQQRRTTVAGAGKEVHPAVLALGLQLRDYVVCGSSARCVATLLAFKRVSI